MRAEVQQAPVYPPPRPQYTLSHLAQQHSHIHVLQEPLNVEPSKVPHALSCFKHQRPKSLPPLQFAKGGRIFHPFPRLSNDIQIMIWKQAFANLDRHWVVGRTREGLDDKPLYTTSPFDGTQLDDLKRMYTPYWRSRIGNYTLIPKLTGGFQYLSSQHELDFMPLYDVSGKLWVPLSYDSGIPSLLRVCYLSRLATLEALRDVVLDVLKDGYPYGDDGAEQEGKLLKIIDNHLFFMRSGIPVAQFAAENLLRYLPRNRTSALPPTCSTPKPT